MNLRTTNGQLYLEFAGTRLQVANNGYQKSTAVGGRFVRFFTVLAVPALGPRQNFQVNDSIAILVKPNEVRSANIRWSLREPWEATSTNVENLTRGGGFAGPGGVQTNPYVGGYFGTNTGTQGAGPFLTGYHAGPTGHPAGEVVEHTSDPLP